MKLGIRGYHLTIPDELRRHPTERRLHFALSRCGALTLNVTVRFAVALTSSVALL